MSAPLKPVSLSPELLAILHRYKPTADMLGVGTNPFYPNGCPILPEGPQRDDL